jgi:heme exporter protein A
MLIGRNIAKRYLDRPVLGRLDFQVEPGEVVGITGGNGSGKSTLLRIVAGLTAPSRGEVTWNGKSTYGLCALAAPDAPLYRELTSLENLEFFTRGMATKGELTGQLAAYDLEARAHDIAGELSSGLRARLQLAVAAWFAHPMLLLDEPSANLDEAGRSLVRELLKKQRGHGITLLATNDSRDVELCDRTLRISRGHFG